MDLAEIRKNIDRVDQEMRQLFIERMSLAEQIVLRKSETGDSIYKPDREKDIIIRNSSFVDAAIVAEYQAFLKKTMGVSRKYQYGRMLKLRDDLPLAINNRRDGNRTENGISDKFFSGHLVVMPEHDRFKITFSCADLAAVISMIADYQVKITEIHSSHPKIGSEGELGDDQFFLEIAGNLDQPDMHGLIYQLSQETNAFKILESYQCEGNNT